MDDKAEKIALFRYGVIAPLVLESLPRGELTRRAQEIAARHYDIPYSGRRSLSVDTLLDWALRYRKDGFPALSPKPRQDRGQARAVPPETAALIERLKRENPHRTGTALLRELALSSEQHQAGLSASTLYRFLRARGLTERQLLLDKATAHKKYEAQFANQIWQSDMLFGPWVQRPGGGKRQVFLQATLDDASRLIPHAQFYPNQGLDSFLDCLRQAIAARGLPTRLYMDNAKIYRSPQLARIAASIGILIVHTPPYQPQGRGKIERYFRSLREQFLANLDPKILLSLEERKRVAVLFRAALRGTLVVHCGAQTTADTVALAGHAAEIGADGVAVIPPPYFPLDDSALAVHLLAAARACDRRRFENFVPVLSV